MPDIYTAEELFKFITGCEFSDTLALLDLKQAFKPKPHLVYKPGIELDDKFDIYWEKAETGAIPIVEKLIPEVEIPQVEPVQA